MVKREREETGPGIDAALPALAAAVAAGPATDASSLAAAAAAECQARQSLVDAIKARPVKAVLDVSALQAFKAQHVAMMKRTEGTSTASNTLSK